MGVVAAGVRILQVLSVVNLHGKCTSTYPMERRWPMGVVGAAIRMILQALSVIKTHGECTVSNGTHLFDDDAELEP